MNKFRTFRYVGATLVALMFVTALVLANAESKITPMPSPTISPTSWDGVLNMYTSPYNRPAGDCHADRAEGDLPTNHDPWCVYAEGGQPSITHANPPKKDPTKIHPTLIVSTPTPPTQNTPTQTIPTQPTSNTSIPPEPTDEPTHVAPTPHPTHVPEPTKKPKCNNGEGNGSEGCSPSDNGNNDENTTTPSEDHAKHSDGTIVGLSALLIGMWMSIRRKIGIAWRNAHRHNPNESLEEMES